MTTDVQALLNKVIRPDDEDSGVSVAFIAEKAEISTRTVYRVLQGTTPSISLDLADRLCIAASSHLLNCRLVWPDGSITPYFHVYL